MDALTAEIGGLAIETDVTDREQARAAVDRAAQELGRLDIVVNNAGVMLLGPIVDAPVEEWDRMIQVNLQGLLYIAHAALPHLLRAAESEPRRVADLVNVSSVAGRRVGAGGGIYQLTKHGVGTFSEALRQEVTARHVRSSLVEPGATESELVTHLREEIRDQLPPASTTSSRRRTSPTPSSTSSRAHDTWRSTRSWSARRSRCARAGGRTAPSDRPEAWSLSPRGVTARWSSANTPSAANVTSATTMQAASWPSGP